MLLLLGGYMVNNAQTLKLFSKCVDNILKEKVLSTQQRIIEMVARTLYNAGTKGYVLLCERFRTIPYIYEKTQRCL